MTVHTRLRSFVAVAGVSLLAAQLGLGCGTSASGLCDEICDCVGCSDNERDDCIDDIEDTERAAENEGCEDQYDDYISCFDEELECRDSELDADGCDSEAKSLAKCLDGAVSIGGVNACDQLYRYLEDCGFELGDPDEAECTQEAEDIARCLLGQSCEALQDGTAFGACADPGQPAPGN